MARATCTRLSSRRCSTRSTAARWPLTKTAPPSSAALPSSPIARILVLASTVPRLHSRPLSERLIRSLLHHIPHRSNAILPTLPHFFSFPLPFLSHPSLVPLVSLPAAHRAALIAASLSIARLVHLEPTHASCPLPSLLSHPSLCTLVRVLLPSFPAFVGWAEGWPRTER